MYDSTQLAALVSSNESATACVLQLAYRSKVAKGKHLRRPRSTTSQRVEN